MPRLVRMLIVAVLGTCFLSRSIETTLLANTWTKVDEGQTGIREGSVLVHIPELKQMMLVGLAKNAPFVQAFDPEKQRWTTFAEAEPFKSDFNNPNKQPAFTFRAVYDPGSRCIYCLSVGNILYAFDIVAKRWKAFPPAAELDGIAWPTLACDPVRRKLVIVGAEKQTQPLGWSRTIVFDLSTETWSILNNIPAAIRTEHEQLIAATEALIDLGGRIRLAWYRDPQGRGTDAERQSLSERIAQVKRLPVLEPILTELEMIGRLVTEQQMLEALQRTRRAQRTIEERAEEQYPVPCSRRNSPLVFDPENRRFVLFGGDHLDYLMNDTWLLDLEQGTWRRAKPEHAPSPRAGHALIHLPGCQRIALYEGYMQSPSTDYGSMPWSMITPVQLWLYDVKANRWELAARWDAPDTKKDTGDTIAPVGFFYGGEGNNRYSAPAIAADANDRLVLVQADTQKVYWTRWHRPAATWMLTLDPKQRDESGTAKLATAPNQRLPRPAPFRAEYCEVDEPPAPIIELDRLPANQWVKLPAAPRNPAKGCRGRDWSTSIWDPDRDQILLWGGGHCVRSASTVMHYSPLSGRIVEGFDADESYGSNSPADGTLAHDSSLLGRPWVSVHNYKHYAYDPRCKLLVSGRGYLYDPERMDWLRIDKQTLPYHFAWGSTVLASSRHGVITWARKLRGEDAGLWRFDRDQGWQELEPTVKLVVPYCDTHGMVYDSKRDRMILSGVGGGYNRSTDGRLLTYDFTTKAITHITPANIELGQTRGCLREMAYVDHADWVVFGLNVQVGEVKRGKTYTRIYDCANNRYGLLDAGTVPDSYSTGWMYDAKRKLVYVFNVHGEAWALRIDPQSAKWLDRVPTGSAE